MKKIFSDNNWLSENEFNSEIFISDESVYEVIRIIRGVPLFLEDHFQRLLLSVHLKGVSTNLDFNEFKENITKVVIMNQQLEGNIRFVFSISDHVAHWVFGFIPHHYPDEADYLSGVSVDFLNVERDIPNAKIIQHTVREKADRMISEQELFEVLLVDQKGKITEGSRSNVFFVKNDVFYTAPDSMVLIGITRQKVIECLRELNYFVVEEPVDVNEINLFDSVFLTGTSPKVLPVRSVGNQLFNTRYLSVNKVMKCYNDLIARYIHLRN